MSFFLVFTIRFCKLAKLHQWKTQATSAMTFTQKRFTKVPEKCHHFNQFTYLHCIKLKATFQGHVSSIGNKMILKRNQDGCSCYRMVNDKNHRYSTFFSLQMEIIKTFLSHTVTEQNSWLIIGTLFRLQLQQQ